MTSQAMAWTTERSRGGKAVLAAAPRSIFQGKIPSRPPSPPPLYRDRVHAHPLARLGVGKGWFSLQEANQGGPLPPRRRGRSLADDSPGKGQEFRRKRRLVRRPRAAHGRHPVAKTGGVSIQLPSEYEQNRGKETSSVFVKRTTKDCIVSSDEKTSIQARL